MSFGMSSLLKWRFTHKDAEMSWEQIEFARKLLSGKYIYHIPVSRDEHEWYEREIAPIFKEVADKLFPE